MDPIVITVPYIAIDADVERLIDDYIAARRPIPPAKLMTPAPFPLHTDEDYRRALALVDALWDAEPGSAEWATLDIMATLIDAYERASVRSPGGARAARTVRNRLPSPKA